MQNKIKFSINSYSWYEDVATSCGDIFEYYHGIILIYQKYYKIS